MSRAAALAAAGISQASLARALGLARSSVHHYLRHGRELGRTEQEIEGALSGLGASPELIARWRGAGNEPHAAPEGQESSPSRAATRGGGVDAKTEEADMLLEAYKLTEAELTHFGLARTPFGEVGEVADLYPWDAYRRVREQLFAAARTGEFLAVVGESGSGKTTLLQDLEERIAQEIQKIILIKPHVEQMEATDRRGKTLKAAHIAEAILREITPAARVKQSPEARMEQVRLALREGARAGVRFALIIEEAHGLPHATLRHLKRFMELREGFKRFLAVLLLGQTELRHRLDPKDHTVREVVQRCGLVTLPPLDERELRGYLAHRLARAGAPLDAVIDEGGLAELYRRLSEARLCYPLAAHNLLGRAMGKAARVRAPRVTAAAIKGV